MFYRFIKLKLFLLMLFPSFAHAGDMVQKVINEDIDYQSAVASLIGSDKRDGRCWTDSQIPLFPPPQRVLKYDSEIPLKKGENFAECQINTKDGRQKVTNANKWPYSCIVKLHLILGPNQTAGGTGVVIGPQHILTAAHNIYYMRQWTKEIFAIPAYDDGMAPFGEASATQFCIFPEWMTSQNEDYDIAVIILDRPIGRMTGWMGIMSLGDQKLKDFDVSITGYPGDKDNARIMYTMRNSISSMTGEKLFYDIDTYSGQSGSPIWTQVYDNRPYTLGIHAYGQKVKGEGNSGTRLTKDKMNKLVEYGLQHTWQVNENMNLPIKDPEEQEREGIRLYQEKNYQNAMLYLKIASKKNREIAQYYLALCYKEKQNPDTKETLKWLTKSADLRYPEAQNLLGSFYYEGEIVEKDHIKAADLFRQAAEKGNVEAQESLAQCYKKGHGVPKDLKQAGYWLNKAATAWQSDSDHSPSISPTFNESPSRPSSVIKNGRRALQLSNVEEDPLSGKNNANEPAPTKCIQSKTIESCLQQMECLHTGLSVENLNSQQSLNLNKRINSTHIQALATILPKMNNLKELLLNDDDIGDEEVAILGTAFFHTTKLTKLTFYKNNISDRGISILSPAFSLMRNLYHLNLSNNNIGTQGIKALVDVIKMMNSLTILEMQHNKIGDEGAIMLALVLPAMIALKELYLYSNMIGPNGNKLLVEKKKPNLVKLLVDSQIMDLRTNAKIMSKDDLKKETILQWCNLVVNSNDQNAFKNLKEAAEKGHAVAQNGLGVLYREGILLKQDSALSVTWFRKAVDQDYAMAHYNLGNCYYDGQGVEKDLKQAVICYRKAAGQGNAGAQFNLGNCYYNGHGVERDFIQAVIWYRKAADQGNAEAQFNLGNCYRNAHGAEKDIKQAVIWYRKAAEQNHKDAIIALKRLA